MYCGRGSDGITGCRFEQTPAAAIKVAVKLDSEVHDIDVQSEASPRRLCFSGASCMADTLEGPLFPASLGRFRSPRCDAVVILNLEHGGATGIPHCHMRSRDGPSMISIRVPFAGRSSMS